MARCDRWAQALLNLAGSLLFLVASAFYFFEEGWWEGAEWGVRFPFALGSACFMVGAFVSLPEVLSD